ncbi:MAG: hypothetical protein WC334_08255 [Kiritimatiellales bacterium]
MKVICVIGIVGLAAAGAFTVRAEVPSAVSAVRVPDVEKENIPAAQTAVLRQIIGLIDQNRTDEAATLFASLQKKDEPASPIQEFVSARLDIAQGRYTEALQRLAQIAVFHNRDAEWAPAALFFEGLVYKQTGHPETARQVSEDLLLGWPESAWSRRADELK